MGTIYFVCFSRNNLDQDIVYRSTENEVRLGTGTTTLRQRRKFVSHSGQRPLLPRNLPPQPSTYTPTHPLTMAALNDLPYETLVDLLSLLSCADLASIIRVSRRFHDISLPLLYKAPCLARTPRVHPRVPGTLGIFLRTLLTPGRVALGSHVCSLRLEMDDTEPVFEYPDDSVARITTMASELGIHNPLSAHDPQLMLVLDLLPRLHTLYISPPNARFLEVAGTLPRGLRSLREMHYIRNDTLDFLKPARILLPMELPSIRSITVPDVSRLQMPVDAMEAAAGTSPITHLRFSHATFSAWALRFVLPVPIALTHFSYSAVLRYTFNLPNFMRALAPLRLSLQYLYLDFCGLGLTSSDGEEVFRLPYDEGSLREWPVLRTVRCSLVPLLGKVKLDGSPRLMDVLPPGLRELEILQDWQWGVPEVADQVVEMLAQKQWAVPRLEKVAVVMEWGGTQRSVDRLTAACEAAGVSLEEGLSGW